MNFPNTYNLDTNVLQTLSDFTELLLHWNERIQLTATRDKSEFVSRHIVDSLELAQDIPSGSSRMLDVGSGGGLPGIVLAIVRPDIQFTLIEPTKKKHAFLSTARRKLELTNLKSFAIRDDELKDREDFMPFDYAIARAVWALDVWFERGKDLVRPGGILFGMEGREKVKLPGITRRSYKLEDRDRAIVSLQVGQQ